ncbi:HRDC domain-containing protein [Jejuia pallidilutea]|uniref:HRDC domain-containing protein n=1 Tax=Jejuia pallidilutea TaxID=504487 RepID=A0A362WWN3_9FLAO|nr:helix-turn-helix domain-containing protein [Jejuia pallidilutea]PQV44769.1 HRDC domain-containing protein [Jejuia pallidilutea]
MAENKELELAWAFVNHTNRSIFLTGKAGTGKTTFLHRLKMHSLKRLVVVAPTGVAAINAKGVTIHSFFQMPFGPILPEADLNLNKGFNRRFSKTKINIIKSMDLLVIDEISMVRADLLDGIDRTLRRFRNRNKVFGGVQVLMIGDLQQLSPVIKEQEWDLLKQVYTNGFFFSSNAFRDCNAITIELQHIYRQENPKFIDILSSIRTNSLTEEVAAELNKRYIPDFKPESDAGYISLTTHNNKAETVNREELANLKGKTFTYTAKVDGKFPEYAYPNAVDLKLKVGAQVMFVKNDSSPEKRYFNGKIGKVKHLDANEVLVHCPDDDFNIIVTPEVWENINYSVDTETKAITEEKIGSYTQIPLRLAWSITIHKSQGLTFEKAIIDAGSAFAHGQTYVALSRCKTLEGLVLKSKIHANQIISDDNVSRFNAEAEENAPDEQVLKDSQQEFQLDLIAEIFEFYGFLHSLNRILDVYYKNRTIIEGPIEATFLPIKDCITNFLKVANGFNAQLKQLSVNEGLAEDSAVIQERFRKAIAYFNTETETKILESLKTFAFTTDNQAIGADITKQLYDFEDLLTIKVLYFKGMVSGFNTTRFLELRAKSVFSGKEKPKKQRKTVIDGTSNVELFETLRLLRNDIAEEQDLIHYQIFSQKTLYEMCETLPTTKQELLEVNGMGKRRVGKYGDAILKVIRDYCKAHDIETSPDVEFFEAPKPKPKKGDTKKESLALFESGKTVEEIADIRELNTNTIIGHLASFISSGKVKITDLMSAKHYKELKVIIPEKTFENLSDLKHQLDDKYSYGELRLVLNELSNSQ